jgi:hypothetical protein
MTIYESLDDLPLYCWDKYMTQDNDNWLINGFDGRQSIIKDDKLTETATRLKDEYFSIAGGDMFVSKLQKGAKRDYLILKYDTIKNLLELLMHDAVINNAETRLFCIQQLRKFGITIPEINSYEGDVEAINGAISSMDGIVTQINILNDDLKRDEVKSNLNKELILVSIGLELGYRIDPKVTSVSEWLEMINLLKEKNEKLKD